MIERFSRYRFDMSGSQLPGSGKWVPYLEIRVDANGQGDEEVIFPRQRISKDDVFDTESLAIEEARRFARAHVSSGEF